MAGKWFLWWSWGWRLCVIMLLGSLPLSSVLASGSWLGNAPDEAWASPSLPVLKAVSSLSASDPTVNGNFDCAELTYRMIDDLTKTMRRGCFMNTAFGLFDYNDQIVIFNGSSEGEAVHANAGATSYLPLPYSADVAAIGGFPAVGSYLQLYTYFPAVLQDERDLNLQRYKQVMTGPNLTPRDNSGQAITVNPGALAYSSRGQWLVTEAPGHGLLRINTATLSLLPFGAQLPSPTPSPTALAQAQLTISDDGRYAVVADSAARSFVVYDLATCGGGSASDDLAPQSCQSHDYWSYLGSQIVGLQAVSRLRFLNDGLISFEARTAAGVTAYELAPSGQISSLINYLGLGDSYSSGEGAFDYLSGTATAANKCHLSSHAYPLLLSQDEFSGGGHSVACSGAKIADIGSTSTDYSGQTTDNRPVSAREADGSAAAILSGFSPGYLAQQDFVRQYQPGVITVGVGGNDIGFSDVLLKCVSPLASLSPPQLNPDSCYSSYEDRLELTRTIDRTYQKWVDLYAKLRQAAPNARIYAIGYPQLAAGSACALNVRLTAAEVQFSRDLVDYLNRVIAAAAGTAGVNYVDVGQAFAGHRLCEASGDGLAVNGLTAGNDAFGLLGKESYHPTALGQELLEQAILRATRNFAASDPAPDPAVNPPAATATDPLLDAPVSGRAINTVIPDDSITPDSVAPGGSLSFIINGLADGLRSGSVYTISLGDGTVLGSLTADSDGNLSGSLRLPANAGGGLQTITVSGQNGDGDPIVITKVIYIEVSSEDYDGDGLPNAQDSCPTVTGSGVDADHDGIDDACDSTISAPSSGTGQTPPGDNGSSAAGDGQSDGLTAGSSWPSLRAATPQVAATFDVAASGVAPMATGPDTPQKARSPQGTSSILGARTRLRPAAAPAVLTGRPVSYLPLNVINWLPWAIGGGLVIIVLLLVSSGLKQGKGWGT